MAHIDDAPLGLRIIINELRGVESWTEADSGFYVYDKVKGRSKRRKFHVPLILVEAAQRSHDEGTSRAFTRWADLREIKD